MGRQNISTLALTVKATGAIAQYRAVGFSGAQATVQGQKIIGVARHVAAVNDQVTVDVKGTAIIESGAAIAVGDALIVDAQGRAMPASALAVRAGATAMTSTAANGAGVLSGSETPEYTFADALEAATAAGQFIEVLLRR